MKFGGKKNHLISGIEEMYVCVCVCVCVWSAVGNGSVPVGPVVRLVHPIRAHCPSVSCRLLIEEISMYFLLSIQRYEEQSSFFLILLTESLIN